MQNDLALEAFDRLRVREVVGDRGDSAASFLAKFQSTAASLEPDERIELVVYAYESSMELLKAVLSDPQANKICSLLWGYSGKEDVDSIVPLLTSNCPELASLQAEFRNHFALDFVSSIFEHPSNRIKVINISPNTKGDLARFFAALEQSQVSALTLFSGDCPEFTQCLHEYLAKDLLVRLKVFYSGLASSEMTALLAKCARLAKLEMMYYKFSESTAFTHLPKSITKLVLYGCTFVGGFDWSFLADSNVQELDFLNVRGVDGNQLGSALAVHLRAKGLDTLRFSTVSFTNETLAAVGVEVGRIKRLDLGYSNLNDASVELIAFALQSPDSEMRELALLYDDNTASSIENHLVSALKHPNCNLVTLSLSGYGGAAKTVEDFYKRLALFALLQGKQVRRRSPCPLMRLPVEMLRLVGRTLI